ncbi:MAG: hypothetical protein WCG27_02765 [Pseudomonadota bacterium]
MKKSLKVIIIFRMRWDSAKRSKKLPVFTPPGHLADLSLPSGSLSIHRMPVSSLLIPSSQALK